MRNWSVIQWIVAIIVVAGFVAIMWIALGVMGITIPQWVIAMLTVVAVVIIAIACLGAIVAVWKSWFPPGSPPT